MAEKAKHLRSVQPLPNQDPLIRKARLSDVNEMFRIINYYAESQLMLPKTQLQLYENLRDYSVISEASAPHRILGCGALHIYWENLAEIRALAVTAEMTHKGVGTALVEKLLDEARELGIEIPTLCYYEHMVPYAACRICANV